MSIFLDQGVKTSVAVVAGAAGFVGSHLVDRLLAAGLQVIGVDNFVTGKKRNLDHLRDNPNFAFIEQDISEKLDIPGPIHYIFNMASPASPIDYVQIPIETLKVGSYGAHHCLELALKNNAVCLVASTSEVYGDPLIHPQPETYWGNVNSIGIRSCYDEAKRYMEAATMAYHRKYDLRTRIVRIFNTYGPRMRLDDGRVVPAFIGQVLANKPITIFGDGSQTRSFCYVSDLVEGLWRLAQSDCAEPVNIGNPHEMTIGQFAQHIIKLSGCNPGIDYRSLPPDDPKLRKPDITRAKQILDWVPQVPFEEGIKLTMDYFKNDPLTPRC
ncbi:MAG: UDP-glucuronic acid decarboxylase family protein [Akkermansia sp.]